MFHKIEKEPNFRRQILVRDELDNYLSSVENRRPEHVSSLRETARRGREHLDFYDSPAGGEVKSLVICDSFSHPAPIVKYIEMQGKTIKQEQEEDKSENINPEITKNFVAFIKDKSEKGIYRVKVNIGDKVVPIDVYPTVFPPKSDYSVSSRSVFEAFGDIQGLDVADIGSGSGMESIIAIMAGAKHVDAADINLQAVECTKHNAEINGLQDRIKVFYSNLFSNFPRKRYDLIIANLPIVNFDAGEDSISKALYDKDFKTRKRLFAEAKEFLTENGIITFTYANLQSAKTEHSDYDFEALEKLIIEYGYYVVEKISREDMGYKWINYKIKLKK